METWRPIPGYEGRYDVSDLGRVRSWLPHHGLPTPRLLTPGIGSARYALVRLTDADSRLRTHNVHRLVATTFIGPYPITKPRTETRHLNGSRLDNRAANLAYGTTSENARDTIRHGRHRYASTTHCPQGHPYDEANTRSRPDGHRECSICINEHIRTRRARLPLGTLPKTLRTHCQRGHEFTPENTWVGHGSRQCRACNREAMRRRYAAKRR